MVLGREKHTCILAGSGQVFISDFPTEVWVKFTTTSLEKRKVYVYRSFFAWEILDVIGHV